MFYYNYSSRDCTQSIKKGILSSFKNGSSLTKLIYINIAVFLLSAIISIPLMILGCDKYLYYNTLLGWLGVPADIDNLIHRPWTIISYMFVHFEFMHLLFNMLWLQWFGKMFLKHFSDRQLLGLYLFGGIVGAILYILCFNYSPYFTPITRINSWTIGASASIMAITIAICTYMPKQNVFIFLFGPVRLIFIALFIILIDAVSIQTSNPGGHIAHLGGAISGILFTLAIRKNIDITKWITFLFYKNHKQTYYSDQKMKFEYTDNGNCRHTDKRDKHERINDILDKISNSGYDSLTSEEKEILFKADEN